MAKAADVIVMVISASDGWTPADEIIFQRIWGTDGILRQRKEQTGGVLAGPMAPPSQLATVVDVCGVGLSFNIVFSLSQHCRIILQLNLCERVKFIPISVGIVQECEDQPGSGSVQTPSLLVVNKVDRAAAGSVILPQEVQNAFFKRVATCATQGVGLQELDFAILDLVGLGHVSSEGQQWAVNQASTCLELCEV